MTAGAVLVTLALLLGSISSVRLTAIRLLGLPTSAEQTATAQAEKLAREWAALEARPVNLPRLPLGSACPYSLGLPISDGLLPALGQSPVYAVQVGGAEGMLQYAAPSSFGNVSGLAGQYVLWVVARGYMGPVLVRGRQLDGDAPLRFNGGVAQPDALNVSLFSTEPPLPELRMLPGAMPEALDTLGQTDTRVPGSGCYAYQVDGLTFSEVIVFQAEPLPLSDSG